MSVEGNIVTVDSYKFEIDRSVPKIKGNLGQSEIKLTKEVTKYLGKNTSKKYEVQALITIESKQEIEKVIVERPDKTTFEITPGEDKKKITKDIEIELDQQYKATIETKDGKTEERTIIETSNESIKTKEELVAFRDKVNQGLTYEGKTINLVENLKLNEICGEDVKGQKVSFEPIGNYGTDNTHIFKGIFNGNYHTIDYLYIDTDKDYQGLFGYIDGGTIKNLIIGEHSSVTGKNEVGGIAGGIFFSSIINCGNKANITGNEYVGGVIGFCDGVLEITQSYNNGRIKGNLRVGGICGCFFGARRKCKILL